MKEQTSKPSVDSTKYRIELKKLDSYDKSLLDRWTYANVDSSELENESTWKIRAKRIEMEGYSIHLLIEKNVKVTQDKTADCLIILMKSKILENGYLKGITLDNAEVIYNRLIPLNLFKCSLETFLSEGCLTDTDFKIDRVIDMETFDYSIKILKELSRITKIKDQGFTHYNEKNNKGIEWGKRESSAYMTSPYIKMYHKGLELKGKSKDFKDAHLGNVDTNNLVRLEATVKNKTHYKKFGIIDTSLKGVLSLSQDDLMNIITKSLQSHLTGTTVIKTKAKNPNKMSPTEIIICQSLIGMMEGANMTYEGVKDFMLSPIHDRKEKSRKKKLIERIYLTQIKGEDLDKKVIQMNGFLRTMGVAI